MKYFYYFLLGNFASSLGDAMRKIIIVLYLLKTTGSSGVAIATVTALESIPYFILAPLAGTVFDLYNRKYILIFSSLSRAIFSLLLAYALVNNHVLMIYVLILLSSCAEVFGDAATAVVIQHTLPKEKYSWANGVYTTAMQTSFVIGPAIGAILFKYSFAYFALIMDALSFLISIVFLFLIKPSLKHPESVEADNIIKSAASGLKYIFNNSSVYLICVITILLYATVGLNSNSMIFFVRDILKLDPANIAWLSTANGLMQILAGGMIIVFSKSVKSSQLLLISSIIMLIGSIITPFSPSIYVLVFSVLLFSFGNSPFNIARSTVMQSTVPSEFMGRVQSFLGMFGTLIALLSAYLSGFFVDSHLTRYPLILSSILSALVFGLVIVYNKKHSNRLEAKA
ncbi:MFS transporter [Deinococcus xianganensis]|uniref:MFS transporter n=1 Tax=Deinococcus xianganensis TaxID=1507289 RepID=A0A6I4YJS0_9DEIO|nr:MFS transporter [Deinococcus xianganensis]MXV21742.1 MFS transporter [Deinococcus xianganensis]